MEPKAYFSNIHEVIIDQLQKAQNEISAAIAWFTDRDIFEVLCKKVTTGVDISIVLIADEINQGAGGLNFTRLKNLGGKVIFIPSGSSKDPIMHHKFCVIDGRTVITGSYNWSKKARSNDENITIISDDSSFAGKFLATFDKLSVKSGQAAEYANVDKEAARRRLEMIKNLILLAEHEDIQGHLRKLRPFAEELKLTHIINSLDSGEFKVVLQQIDLYLRNATALVEAGSVDIALLKFQLEMLEVRLESLSDEKDEAERKIIIFNRRYDDALGDLVKRLLNAKANLARLIAENNTTEHGRDEAEEEARRAEENYKEYTQQHEELQQSEPLAELDEDAERELKLLYRKACNLCHPDKVSDAQKEDAHKIFIELQNAYKFNDLNRVREIYEMLKTNGILQIRSTILTEVETLRAAVAEMEFAISRIVSELKALHESAGYQLLLSAGETDSDWSAYFIRQRELLETELVKIVDEIAEYHLDDTTYAVSR